MQVIPVAQRGFGQTTRRDAWWATPLVVFTVFTSFIVYATWAAFQNQHYTYGPYLSPFYSPELWGDSPHAWFGPKPAWWPALLPFSPALFILPTGQREFGIGIGTLVLLINVILLSSYTLGCHSGRHIFGGRKDEISKSAVTSACYNRATSLNKRHMPFAWTSLFSVALADVYVRLCSMGVLTDWRIV